MDILGDIMKIVYGYLKMYNRYKKEVYFNKSLNRLRALYVNYLITKEEFKICRKRLWRLRFENYSNINLQYYPLYKIIRNLE